MLPPNVMVQLLDASNNIPLIFTVVMSSGFVFLQEFSDALTSITWNSHAEKGEEGGQCFPSSTSAASPSVTVSGNCENTVSAPMLIIEQQICVNSSCDIYYK